MAVRFGKPDHAATGKIGGAKPHPRKAIDASLHAGRGRDVRMREVAVREDTQIAEGAMALGDQEPVERPARSLGAQPAGEPAKRFQQRLLAPIAVIDDGIAREDRTTPLGVNLEVEPRQRREPAQRLAIAQLDHDRLVAEIGAEQRVRSAIVVVRVELVHARDVALVELRPGAYCCRQASHAAIDT